VESAPSSTSVAVVGLGAIGTRLVVELACAGTIDVFACARRKLVSLELFGVEAPLDCTPRIEVDPAHASRVDWVLLCTKAQQVESARDWLRALRRDDTPVAVLQNGVEHRERLAAMVRGELVVPVVVEAPTERVRDGSVRAHGPARLYVSRDALGQRFAELFRGSNVVVEEVDDVRALAWTKLVHNCAGAARALENRSTLAAVLGRRELAARLAAEAVEVATALGVVLPTETLESAVSAALALGPGRSTSLEADLAARRPTEVDARNGAVARLGAQLGVVVRWNALALQCLR
jgi:2-dehydropantoate 2-reductase